MAIAIQTDVPHDCHVATWNCTACGDDFCSEQPKFCLSCGARFTRVVDSIDWLKIEQRTQ